jgi:hypothetical protein
MDWRSDDLLRFDSTFIFIEASGHHIAGAKEG